MIKVLLIFGTRPEAIKMAPVKNMLDKCADVDNIVCVTGQHREMLDQVLEIFKIKPDYDLDIMERSQTLVAITTKVMEGIDKVIKDTAPDLVLVHGDTTTTFASSLVSFYNKVPVGHVEAGLRSYNKYEPFPEEINRILTSNSSDLHFAPTKSNKINLQNEGIKGDVFITGNTVVDAIMQMAVPNYVFKEDILNKLCYHNSNKLVLLTAHRRENLGQPLVNISNAVKKLVKKNTDIEIVYPVHLNPAVRECVYPVLSDVERVHLIEPIEVQDMHNLIKNCHLILTDSGGLQEEAPVFNKPIVVLRDVTERPEICEVGKAVLAGTDEQNVFSKADEILNNGNLYRKMQKSKNPYGDGRASERIVHAIRYWFGLTDTKPTEFE